MACWWWFELLSLLIIKYLSSASAGTGLKIPPAAQQALQMTGSIPFGNMAASGNKYWSSCFIVWVLKKVQWPVCFLLSCPSPNTKPSIEPPLPAAGYTLPAAVQPLQPTVVSPNSSSFQPSHHFECNNTDDVFQGKRSELGHRDPGWRDRGVQQARRNRSHLCR